MVISSAMACAPKAAELKPIKIGFLMPYSGLDQIAPKSCEEGSELKLEEVGWQFQGRPIQLIKEDTACDPSIGVEKARKLVESDKVAVIMGPLFTDVVIAVEKYLTTASKTPLLLQDESAYECNKSPARNFFAHGGTMAGGTYQLGTYAYKAGYRTATLILQDFAAGDEYVLKGFAAGFESQGGKIVQTQRVPLGTMDYAPYVTSLKEADILATWVIPPEMLLLLEQYYGYGKKMPVLIANECGWPELLMPELGDNTVGIVTNLWWARSLDTPANKQFIDAYVKKYGKSPELFAAGNYTTMSIFLEALI